MQISQADLEKVEGALNVSIHTVRDLEHALKSLDKGDTENYVSQGNIDSAKKVISDALTTLANLQPSQEGDLVKIARKREEGLHYCFGFINGLDHENKEQVLKTISNYLSPITTTRAHGSLEEGK